MSVARTNGELLRQCDDAADRLKVDLWASRHALAEIERLAQAIRSGGPLPPLSGVAADVFDDKGLAAAGAGVQIGGMFS